MVSIIFSSWMFAITEVLKLLYFIYVHLFVLCEISFGIYALIKLLTRLHDINTVWLCNLLCNINTFTRNSSFSLFLTLSGLCLTVAGIWLETQALWAVKDSHHSTNPTANVPGTSQWVHFEFTLEILRHPGAESQSKSLYLCPFVLGSRRQCGHALLQDFWPGGWPSLPLRLCGCV